MSFSTEEFKLEIDRGQIEQKEKWRNICNEIPPIHFKSEWKVYIIPPFGGAIARFLIEYKNKTISVYFDYYDRLGIMKQPYYEIYPNEDGDCSRYFVDEVDKMMEHIERLLEDGKEI